MQIWGHPVGSWHRVIWRGFPESTTVPALSGGLLFVSPCRGTWDTTQPAVCTDGEHVSTWIHIWGGMLGCAYPEPRLLGTSPGPCPASFTCGTLEAARTTASPACMALAMAWHGRVPSVGTEDGDQTGRARESLAQTQLPPKVPYSCPGVPLYSVDVY